MSKKFLLLLLPLIGALAGSAQITLRQTQGAPHTEIVNRGFFTSDSAIHMNNDTIRSARINSVAVIGTTWWIQAPHNVTDSSWQLINVGIHANNGLTDSAGTIQIGGLIHKPTVDTINQGNSWGIYFPTGQLGPVPGMWIGQGSSSQNGFFPPLVLGDSLSYVGFNDPFLEMTSIDYPGPNGSLFLNFQPVADSPQVDWRIFTPTIQASTFSLDLNGNPFTGPFTSAYDIFFYGDLTGNQGFGMTGANFAQWHNGPCCFLSAPFGSVFAIDQFNNMLLGPGRDTTTGRGLGYAIPYGRLDIRPSATNSSRIGVFEEDPTDTSKFNGTVVVGLPGVGSVRFPQYTTAQKLAIVSPVEGEQVYDITLHMMSYWNGSVWVNH